MKIDVHLSFDEARGRSWGASLSINGQTVVDDVSAGSSIEALNQVLTDPRVVLGPRPQTTAKLTPTAVVAALKRQGRSKSQTLPSRIKGAPLRTEGYEVRKDGEDVRVVWHPRTGRASNHPEVRRTLSQIAGELAADPRLSVTVEPVRNYLVVRPKAAEPQGVDQELLARALAETMRRLAAQGTGSSTTLEAGAQILEDPVRRGPLWERIIEPTVQEVARQVAHPF